jgi:hypothetical protein
VNAYLIAAGMFTAWVLSLYVYPFGKCWRCRGRRVIIRGGCKACRWLLGDSKRKRKAKPPKAVTCPSCNGIGRGQRPGSRTVHQLARRVSREFARSRNPRRIERTHPDAHRNV